MDDDQIRQITHEVMSDKTVHPILIPPQVSWPLAQMIRLAAAHPARNKWGKKECITIAKKIERIVNAKHPLPMIYGAAQLEPIMLDMEPQEIPLKMCEMWLVVGSVHLGTRHPDLPDLPRKICTDAAHQIEARIVEMHPDSWMLISMGWDERYDS